MSESPNSGDSAGAPTNSKPKIPNTDDGSGANKGRSCKGCLYYSSQFKSDSRNPLCLGLSRSLPNAPRYIVGTSEMEASKDGMILRDFKYGCVGYSIYADQKNRASDPQQSEPELPVCMGIEVLVDRKIKESLADGNKSPVPQHRLPQPANVSRDEFLSRFTRNANLIANGVAKNIRRVGNQIKQSIDDIMYPYRKRPK
ncbi:uncharacterized protein LOC125212509 [Salvia hispanica]|uniref:uncharacterized protein LOC125212509 n=1 Tax=Salvia hispanica TaxID=49212 RepID=UPI0020093F29|nr:uncharacterized protein LOC125212509 [Salvia hispanica]